MTDKNIQQELSTFAESANSQTCLDFRVEQKSRLKGVTFNLPEGFEAMVRGVIGKADWDAFVDALADEPSVSIRLNSKITDNRQQTVDCGLLTVDTTEGSLSAVKWCEHGR